MNKELLINIKNEIETTKEKDFALCIEQWKQLLDYITNLQQENKEYSMIFDTFSKRPYAHKYLEEKKKELNNNKIIGLDSEMVYKDYYDYKSRCEKALHLIKHNDIYDYRVFEEKLENILQGSDKNV